jgi:hypothetical protein
MSTIRNRLFPLSDISAHDELPFYTHATTGLAGELVKIMTGSANPQTDAMDGFSATPVGVSYNGTYSNRYETKWKVVPTVSGDTRYSAIGFTQLSTLEYDENGMPLKYNAQRAKEIGAVVSGEANVITKKASVMGIWGQYIDTSRGAPQPGHVVVISLSGRGLVGAVDPTLAANFRHVSNTGASFVYDDTHVIGKWLSSLPTSSNTGLANEFSAQGGYAFFTFDLNR